jgi:hypothetical protein
VSHHAQPLITISTKIERDHWDTPRTVSRLCDLYLEDYLAHLPFWPRAPGTYHHTPSQLWAPLIRQVSEKFWWCFRPFFAFPCESWFPGPFNLRLSLSVLVPSGSPAKYHTSGLSNRNSLLTFCTLEIPVKLLADLVSPEASCPWLADGHPLTAFFAWLFLCVSSAPLLVRTPVWLVQGPLQQPC